MFALPFKRNSTDINSGNIAIGRGVRESGWGVRENEALFGMAFCQQLRSTKHRVLYLRYSYGKFINHFPNLLIVTHYVGLAGTNPTPPHP